MGMECWSLTGDGDSPVDLKTISDKEVGFQ